MIKTKYPKITAFLRVIYCLLVLLIPLFTVIKLSLNKEFTTTATGFLASTFAFTEVFMGLMLMLLYKYLPKTLKGITLLILISFIIPLLSSWYYELELNIFLVVISIEYIAFIFVPYFYLVVIKSLIEGFKGFKKEKKIITIVGIFVLLCTQLFFLIPGSGALYILSKYLIYQPELLINYIFLALAIIEGSLSNYPLLKKESIFA